MKKIAILSAAIQPVDGLQRRSSLTIEQAKELINGAEVVSYVGHPATATYIKLALDINVETTRGQYAPVVGDIAIAVTAKERLTEGSILSFEEMEGKFNLIILEQIETDNLWHVIYTAFFKKAGTIVSQEQGSLHCYVENCGTGLVFRMWFSPHAYKSYCDANPDLTPDQIVAMFHQLCLSVANGEGHKDTSYATCIQMQIDSRSGLVEFDQAQS